jgi:hypothetical protein
MLGKLQLKQLKITTLNLNKKSYDTIVCMDFIIIFTLGYCFRDLVSYLKSIVNYRTEEWDWISFEKDDLP